MLHHFAATDPQTTLASGNVLAILALIIVTLASVIALLTRYFVKKLDFKDTEIKELNKLIYTEQKAHVEDYKNMAEKDQAVLLGNAQANQLLAAKIEAVKGGQ